MIRVQLDDALRSKLNGLNEPIELCDGSGRTVGHFLPAEDYRRLLYDWAHAQFNDPEELKLARADTGGYTTTEAIAYLENLVRSHRKPS